MTDLFEEVEEQLRSDRYRALGRKALPWVLGVVTLVLLGVFGYWGYDVWRGRNIASASETYEAASQAFTSGDVERARELWRETAQSPSRGYKALALMQLAGIEAQAGRTSEAVKLFDESARAAPDQILGDLARLKSALALLDTAPYADLQARLQPMIEDDRPYRLQAREALAFAKLMAGDTAAARSDFLVLSRSLDGSESLRTRAAASVSLIDSGSANSVPAVAKAAAAPPPAAPPRADGQNPASPQSQSDGSP